MTEYQRFSSRTRELHHSTAILTDDEHQNYVNSGLASDSTIASLSNIGNSCYLNSVLYTLRFTPEFLHKLHHLSHYIASSFKKLSQNRQKSSSLGRNVPGIQPQSGRSWSSKDLASLGNNKEDTIPPHKESCCIATEKLHELYQCLHNNEEKDNLEPLHTGFFLEAIQEISTTFEGNQQQDAHEFLICLVNSIRDACKSLIDLICANPEIIGSDNGPPPADKSNKSPPQPPLKMRFLRPRKKETAPKPPIKEQESDKQQPTGKLAPADDVVIDKEQIMDRIKSLGLDFIREDFEGTTISTTQCLFCETETVQKESMIDLGIQICGVDVGDVAKNPQGFFQKSLVNTERLNNDNKYSCEACGQKTEAVRSITYDVLPRLLILQLKRFSSGMEKINSFIPTPMVLKCFCNECIGKQDCDKKHVYKLYSVITHVGPTMSVGHYIAYITLSNSMEYLNCSSIKSLANNPCQPVNNCSDDQVIQNQNTSNSNNEKGLSGLAKKKLFSVRKAASSNDMTKRLKTNIANGLQKLNLDSANITSGNSAKNSNSNVNSNSCNSNNSIKNCIPCNGLGCCNINQNLYSTTSTNGHHCNPIVNGDSNGVSDAGISVPPDHQQNGSKETHLSQQNWYMCDDDKIKMFTQKEFEDMLQANKKNPVTPYLLFYVRLDNNNNNRPPSNAASQSQ